MDEFKPSYVLYAHKSERYPNRAACVYLEKGDEAFFSSLKTHPKAFGSFALQRKVDLESMKQRNARSEYLSTGCLSKKVNDWSARRFGHSSKKEKL